jgi:DNA end-binding protein Ku
VAEISRNTSWKGFMSVGVLNVPVKLHNGIREDRPSFRNVKVTKVDNAEVVEELSTQYLDSKQAPVEPDELVKGVKTGGQYVTVTKDELDVLAATADKTIRINNFVPAADVNPLMATKPYIVMPDVGGHKAYATIRDGLKKGKKVALGQFVNSTKESMIVIRPMGKVLTAQILCWPSEFVDPLTIEPEGDATPSKAEVDMAVMLINAMAKPYDPNEYVNKTGKAMQELIETKASGAKPVIGKPAAAPSTSTNILDDLSASLEAMKAPKAPATTPKRRARKTKAA